ncbi:DUF2931 family protein [Vibrio sp. M260112]|uniref:DUF2931 family protein n=1 Tax=Vibrio sp. M260112 TaxID=3020895 RepID=UPI002F3F5A0D
MTAEVGPPLFIMMCFFFGRTELKEMRKYAPNYDGYSIALGIPVAIKRQVMPTNVLPDRVYLYWASITNQRFFLTQFNITQKLKREMMVKRKFLTWDEVELDCYEKDIIFGFLPNGNTKVWLDGCGEYKFVTELEPIEEFDMDTFGNEAEAYRIDYGESMKERAKQLGATLDPIPWDKVNKVYSKEEITKLEL